MANNRVNQGMNQMMNQQAGIMSPPQAQMTQMSNPSPRPSMSPSPSLRALSPHPAMSPQQQQQQQQHMSPSPAQPPSNQPLTSPMQHPINSPAQQPITPSSNSVKSDMPGSNMSQHTVENNPVNENDDMLLQFVEQLWYIKRFKFLFILRRHSWFCPHHQKRKKKIKSLAAFTFNDSSIKINFIYTFLELFIRA